MKAHPQSKRNKVFELKAKGMTHSQIAKETGICLSDISKWLAFKELTGSKKTPSKSGLMEPKGLEGRKQEILAYLDDNNVRNLDSLSEAMAACGLSRTPPDYSKHLREWGCRKVEGRWVTPRKGGSSRDTKLAAHIEDIVKKARDGCSVATICSDLREDHGVECTESAVYYRLAQRGVKIGGGLASGSDFDALEAEPAVADEAGETLPVRDLSAHLTDIMQWMETDENITTAGIVNKLLEEKQFKTSPATVSRLLNDHGIRQPKGRKPKNRTRTVSCSDPDIPSGVIPVSPAPVRGNAAGRFKPYRADLISSGLAAMLRTLNMLIEWFGLVNGRTGRNKRHSLASVLLLILVAVTARFNTMHGIAAYLKENEATLAKYMHLPHGVPSEGTFGQVLEGIDRFKLAQVVLGATADFDVEDIKSMPYDGKIMRGIYGKDDDPDQPDGLLTLYLSGPNQSIAAVPYRHGKEIEAARLGSEIAARQYGIRGVIVSGDALHTQTETLSEQTRLEYDICAVVKRNQRKLFKLIADLDRKQRKPAEFYSTSEESHGRREVRNYATVRLDADFHRHWQKMHKDEEVVPPVANVVSERTIRNGETKLKYVIFTTWRGIKWAADIRRSHWDIENRLHNSLDRTFKEDGIIAYKESKGVKLGIINRASLNKVQRFMPELPNSEILMCTRTNILKNLTVIAHQSEAKLPITNSL